VILLAGALLAADTPVAAQGPRMSANRICSTPQGWCPIPTGYTIGAPCYCFVPPSTYVGGYVTQCLWQPPADLYLNPHRSCL
jgi:hypothetical protein